MTFTTSEIGTLLVYLLGAILALTVAILIYTGKRDGHMI